MPKVQLVIELDADQGDQISQLILGKFLPAVGASEPSPATSQASKAAATPVPTPAPSEKPKKAAKVSESAALTLEEVRARLQEIRTAHKELSLAPIFQKYGAARLPDIDPAKYGALMAEVEGMIA